MKKTEDRDEAEPFVRRWMRRKSDAAAKSDEDDRLEQEERERAEAPPDGSDRHEDVPSESAEDDVAKGDEDMPPLETIDDGGSVAEFFSPRVSQELRRAALRRLFSQSRLPVVDDLDDYAGDYTKFTRMGGLVTNEMKHRLEIRP